LTLRGEQSPLDSSPEVSTIFSLEDRGFSTLGINVTPRGKSSSLGSHFAPRVELKNRPLTRLNRPSNFRLGQLQFGPADGAAVGQDEAAPEAAPVEAVAARSLPAHGHALQADRAARL
jgi:hypothetical protein